jgi:hypothetical protein
MIPETTRTVNFTNSQTDGLHTNHNVHLNFTSSGSNGINFIHSRLMIVYIEHLKVTCDDGYSCISVQRNGLYYVRYNYCINVAKTSSSSIGIYVVSGPSSIVEHNYLSNNYAGLRASNCGVIDSNNNDDTGTQPTYGMIAQTNGVIGKTGTQPAGSTGNESQSLGGQIR